MFTMEMVGGNQFSRAVSMMVILTQPMFFNVCRFNPDKYKQTVARSGFCLGRATIILHTFPKFVFRFFYCKICLAVDLYLIMRDCSPEWLKYGA